MKGPKQNDSEYDEPLVDYMLTSGFLCPNRVRKAG